MLKAKGQGCQLRKILPKHMLRLWKSSIDKKRKFVPLKISKFHVFLLDV
jgi:hypothetical protein